MIAAKIILPESFKIGVIGAESWVAALARMLSKNGLSAQLWCHDAKNSHDILTNHLNYFSLVDISLPEILEDSTDLTKVVLSWRILVAFVSFHLTGKIDKNSVLILPSNLSSSFSI